MKIFHDILGAIKERIDPIKSPIPLEKKTKDNILLAIISKFNKPTTPTIPTITPTKTPKPTMTKTQWKAKRLDYIRKGWTLPDMTPEEKAAMPTPTPVPVKPQTKTQELPTPPKEISDLIDAVFGKFSDVAKKVAASENSTFQPDLDSPPNSDGSFDRGIFQINSNTFNDYMRRMPNLLKKNGITSYEDMKNPLLNIRMAKIIFDYQGWDAWKGPGRVGLKLR